MITFIGTPLLILTLAAQKQPAGFVERQAIAVVEPIRWQIGRMTIAPSISFRTATVTGDSWAVGVDFVIPLGGRR